MFSLSGVSDSLWPRGLYPTRLLCPWDFPGKNTGVDCHFLLQGIFLTQALSPHLCIFTLAGGFFTTKSPGKPRSCGSGSKTVRGHQNYLEGLLKHSCLAGFQPQHFWFSRSWIRWNIFFSNGFPGPVDAAGPGTTFSDAVYWSDVCK